MKEKKDPSKTEVVYGKENCETENNSRKSPGNFQWKVIPGESAPYMV